jgi:hypothetical protein
MTRNPEKHPYNPTFSGSIGQSVRTRAVAEKDGIPMTRVTSYSKRLACYQMNRRFDLSIRKLFGDPGLPRTEGIISIN